MTNTQVINPGCQVKLLGKHRRFAGAIPVCPFLLPRRIQETAADVDDKPGVTASDALMILQYATQQIASF